MKKTLPDFYEDHAGYPNHKRTTKWRRAFCVFLHRKTGYCFFKTVYSILNECISKYEDPDHDVLLLLGIELLPGHDETPRYIKDYLQIFFWRKKIEHTYLYNLSIRDLILIRQTLERIEGEWVCCNLQKFLSKKHTKRECNSKNS